VSGGFEVYYNKKRLLFLLVVSLFCLLLMFWTFTNVDNLTQKKPEGIFIYRWVGYLFYEKPLLLKIFSSMVFVLFSYGLIITIKKFQKKKAVLRNFKNQLYIDKKVIISFDDVKDVNVLDYNKNEKYIRIYLTNPEKYINSKNKSIQKYILKSNYRRFGTPLLINMSFYGESPEIIKNKILKLKNYR